MKPIERRAMATMRASTPGPAASNATPSRRSDSDREPVPEWVKHNFGSRLNGGVQRADLGEAVRLYERTKTGGAAPP